MRNIWNGNLDLQCEKLDQVLNVYNDYLTRDTTDWMVKIAIYKSIQPFCKRLNIDSFKNNEKIENFILNNILLGLNDLKFAPVRHQCLCALYEILKLGKYNTLLTDEFMQKIKNIVDDLISNESKPLVVQQAVKVRKDIFLTK